DCDRQRQANLQIILNMLVFSMNPQQAVEVPRFATETVVESFWPHPYKPGVLSVELGIPEHTRAELRALGHTIDVVGACGNGAVMTRRDPDIGVLSAGADPRTDLRPRVLALLLEEAPLTVARPLTALPRPA